MQRFFIAADRDLSAGAPVQLPDELAHQVGRVLRCRPGDQIVLFDGSGAESVVRLDEFSGAVIRGVVIERRPNLAEPTLRLTLYQCLLKGEKLDLVLQKATELGVAAFVPVLSARVVGEAGAAKMQRWSRIVREAAEQSGRGRLPDLRPPLNWRDALDDAALNSALLLIPWEQAPPANHISAALANHPADQSIALFIGPEGGLSEDEAAQARAAGAHLVSLGRLILRAETAAIAAAALVLLRPDTMAEH